MVFSTLVDTCHMIKTVNFLFKILQFFGCHKFQYGQNGTLNFNNYYLFLSEQLFVKVCVWSKTISHLKLSQENLGD